MDHNCLTCGVQLSMPGEFLVYVASISADLCDSHQLGEKIDIDQNSLFSGRYMNEERSIVSTVSTTRRL